MNNLVVTKRNGETETFNPAKIDKAINWATKGLSISPQEVKDATIMLVRPGMPTSEIQKALILAASSLMEKGVDYMDASFVAARLLLLDLYKSVGQTLGTQNKMEYPHLKTYIERGVVEKVLSADLLGLFDLEELNKAIQPEKDLLFGYLGLSTLADRYLVRENVGKKDRKIIELPQHFLMRVAMGISLREDDPTKRAIEFYNLFANHKYLASTPTLFNSGTTHPQLSSCYINTVADSLSTEDGEHRFASIFGTIEECARFSKYAGGIGSDWTRVRAGGDLIKGTQGQSSGVIPYLKVYNDTAVAVNQSSKRLGSFAPYLENWHPDFIKFCELRKNSGDERLRAHDIFPAAWVSDLFMKRVENGGSWSFISPHKYPELHELYGKEFEKRYQEIEQSGDVVGKMPAMELWKKMLTSLFETGHPWITFKDACNLRSPQNHVGVIHSSNLCCVAGDQRVVTSKGIFTAKELYEQGEELEVMGLSDKRQASKMFLPRPDAPMLTILTKEGYTHKVTPDHRVWKRNVGWVEAQDLHQGDKVLLQQKQGLFGDYHDPEGAFQLGATLRADANDCFVDRKPKHIPEIVWRADKKTAKAFLKGLFGNPSSWSFASLVSCDLTLLQETQILWLNLGRKSIIEEVNGFQWVLHSVKKTPPEEMYAVVEHLFDTENEDAYCLTVQSTTHAWVCNGFVTHNTEITLNTSDDETAVCNLGSVNLSKLGDLTTKEGQDDLRQTVRTAVRMLDNVIDINFYPSDRAKKSNLKHRPIGLGVMGYHEYLVQRGIAFESHEHLKEANKLFEKISYYAIEASSDLAVERGAYSTFDGSKWSQGLLPCSTVNQDVDNWLATILDDYSTMNWYELSEKVRKNGMRNSNVMAIAPTATISNILGTTPCIEPPYELQCVKSNLSGPFTWIDPTLRYGKPELCKASFDIDQKWIIRAAAVRQKWIDQSQSINLFAKIGTRGKDLSEWYKLAWKLGLKTTYYLRGQSLDDVKNRPTAPIAPGQTTADVLEQPINMCSIDNPDCESCQ